MVVESISFVLLFWLLSGMYIYICLLLVVSDLLLIPTGLNDLLGLSGMIVLLFIFAA